MNLYAGNVDQVDLALRGYESSKPGVKSEHNGKYS